MLVKAFIKLWKAGVTPISWKESHIALMYKKGDPTLLKNWRPVTLTNTLYKLWTAVVARLISDYAEEAGILSDTQEGFRRQKNTMRQLLRLLTAIEDSELFHKELHILYIDFENAFGSVDHDKLIETLTLLGLPQDVLRVIRDLYPGRDAEGRPMQTCFRMPGGLSETLPILRGTIQGDSLSPLLFILYLEPLLRWMKSGNRGYKHGGDVGVETTAPAYADDLALLTSTIADMRVQATKLQKFTRWAKIKVNVSKCAITGKNYSGGVTTEGLQYRNITYEHPLLAKQAYPYLPPGQTYKYLGVHVCPELRWDKNATDLTSAVRDKLRSIGTSLASPTQRVEIINCTAVQKAAYAAALGVLGVEQLFALDTTLGTAIKQNTGVGKRAKRHNTFISEENGGLGVESLMSIAAKRAIALMQEIVKENADIARAVAGVEKEILRTKGKMAYHIQLAGKKSPVTRFKNRDHKRLCTLRRMHILSRYKLTLQVSNTPLEGYGKGDLRNIAINERELEETQTCEVPLDLNPTQVLADMGVTTISQMARQGHMFSDKDMERTYGSRFGSKQREAYSKICTALCKGAEEERPNLAKTDGKI